MKKGKSISIAELVKGIYNYDYPDTFTINGSMSAFGRARTQLENKGFLIIPCNYRGVGARQKAVEWKIATSQDRELILDELIRRKSRTEGFAGSLKRALNVTQKSKLLKPADVKQIVGQNELLTA